MKCLLFAQTLLLLACAGAFALSAQPRWEDLTPSYSFEQYCRDYRKVYATSAERKERRRIFERELASVLAHNTGSSSYRRTINKFSDMSSEEKRLARPLSAQRTGKEHAGWTMKAHPQVIPTAAPTSASSTIRHSVDYRLASPPVLTPVKDQGLCGSCSFWAANDAIEAYTAIATGKVHVLSAQQLLSCSPEHNMTYTVEHHESPPHGSKVPTLTTKTETEYQFGCDGYWPEVAIDFLVKNQAGEMFTEWMFPYTSYFDQKDEKNPKKPVACESPAKEASNAFTKVTSHVKIPANDQQAMLHHLSTVGPLITIMYVPVEFFSYDSGIFDDKACIANPEMQPSHAVVMVGYGHDATLKQDYWILKNSWNADWGEDGYFRLLRGTQGTNCGFMPVPNDAKTELLNKTACGTCGVESFNTYPTIGATSDFYKGL